MGKITDKINNTLLQNDINTELVPMEDVEYLAIKIIATIVTELEGMKKDEDGDNLECPECRIYEYNQAIDEAIKRIKNL